MNFALLKISCVNDRLIPLGLACLQAYLKTHSVPVRVYNFRTAEYSLPKVASDPLYQLKPPRFIMNHQDFPIAVPIAEYILENREIRFNEGIFFDIISDYARRLYEPSEITQIRYKKMMSYIRGIIPKVHNGYSIVAFSLDYLNVVETVIASCLLKQYDPDIQIIWGGPTITQSSDAFKLFLQKGACDGLVIGEGESPLLDISNDIYLKNVKGLISLKNRHEFYFTPGTHLDLNSLPTPDYSNIPLDTYFKIASVYRSRGCTNRCKFCAEWNLFGPRFRVRSVENVVSDIDTIIENHKPHYMIFGESLINDDLKYFEKLCDAMIKKQFNMKFGTHFRANITKELSQKAFRAGFNDAWVGFEAFSDEDLKEMNKGVTVNQNHATITNLTHAGVNVIAMLVVGFTNIEVEQKNCENILHTIEHFSKEKILKDDGKEFPISIQWRPAPMYLVPGSFDYQEKKLGHTWSWICNIISEENDHYIRELENELSEIPYEFERPIPDETVGDLMRKIQDADRNTGFSIGGIAKHVIAFMMEERRKRRRQKKYEKIGIIAQRYGEIPVQENMKH